jgi:hypothetical protein
MAHCKALLYCNATRMPAVLQCHALRRISAMLLVDRSSLTEKLYMVISPFCRKLCVFMSMFSILCMQLHNTRRLVQASVLGSLIDFEPTHTLHTEFGMIALVCSFVHATGWIVRIVQYGTTGFLLYNQVCIS